MRRLSVLLLLVALVCAGVLAGRAEVRADAGGVPAQPVNGKAVGHGLKLWVHVFYAKGGVPGPPGGGGSVNCTDTNTQTGFAAPFATPSPLSFVANTATFPSYLTTSAVQCALTASARTWNQAAPSTLLRVGFAGSGATVPSENGTSELGWVKIVPKNVLAATWTWVDDNNNVTEADLFYNSSWTWDVFTGCPTAPTGHFEIADIGTHELGHALGLSHFSDTNAQATMYPSAPADEVRKTTLTQGDINALNAALRG